MTSQFPIHLMHFADVHFGVENYGRFDPATGLSTRLIDFRDALTAAIERAIEEGVEIAVFAGDAYKTRDPNQTHQREFAACLSLLTERGIPVALLAGNHDIPNTRGRANAIEIFGALAGDKVRVFDTPDVAVMTTARGRSVQIAGMPYLIKSLILSREEHKDKDVQETTQLVVDRYTAGIRALAMRCDPELPTMLMGHFSVANAKLSANQSSYLANEPEVPLSALTIPPFDYVALGHIHRYQDLNRGAQPPVVYSGSIERIDFGERDEDKGFALVEIGSQSPLSNLSPEDGREATIGRPFHAAVRHVVVPTRKFVEIRLDATGAGELVTEFVVDGVRKTDVVDAVVKLNYVVRSEQVPFVRDAEILGALRDAFLVVSKHREVLRDTDQIRTKLLTESLDPLKALAVYCETRPTLRGRAEELTRYAEALMREVEAEEQVG